MSPPPPPTTRVVFVDDDAFIVAAMRRMMRGLRDKCQLFFVEDPWEAVDLINRGGIDILFSDLQMPRISGADLFRETMRSSPTTVRFALSGQADPLREEPISHLAHGFLPKPCEPDLVESTIHRIMEARQHVTSMDLAEWVPTLIGLPLGLDSDDSTDALATRDDDRLASVDLAELADGNLGLAANIFRLVNFSRPTPLAGLPSEALRSLSHVGQAVSEPVSDRSKRRRTTEALSAWNKRFRERIASELDSKPASPKLPSWKAAFTEVLPHYLKEAFDGEVEATTDDGAEMGDPWRAAANYLAALWRLPVVPSDASKRVSDIKRMAVGSAM